jgi:hypothetical protein
MRARFETLCEEYVQEVEELQATSQVKDWNFVVKDRMDYRRPSYFAYSMFEFCRDAIEAAHQEVEES